MNVLPIAALTSLLLATTAFAQKSSISGHALAGPGQPLANVEVRVQQQNAKTPAAVVRTNAKGAFVARDLAAGDYTVSLHTKNGAVASTVRVKTKGSETARVDFVPQKPVATAAEGAKRRARWVPPPTGSHMGGFADSPYKTRDQEEGYGSQNVGRLSPETLSRMQSQSQVRSSFGQ